MTIYSFDVEERQLVACWETARGSVARLIATLDEAREPQEFFDLAQTLTELSSEIWRLYLLAPSSPDEDGMDRGQGKDFDQILPAITKPHLPQDGYLIVSYVAVVERAHRVGRALHVLADDDLRLRIADDIAEELEAVQRAEQGDLSGRASQATVLTRLDASPTQIDHADAILSQNMFCSAEKFWEVEPAAACVAAAHWLGVAAEVAAEAAGIAAEAVFAEADNIQAVSIEVPAGVVGAMEDGISPRDAVLQLLTGAAAAAEGRIHRMDLLLEGVQEARATARRLGGGAELLRQLLPSRTTPLDPSRAAVDLLAHLLDGLCSCDILFRECVDFGERGEPVIDGVALGHPLGGAWDDYDPDDDDDPEYDDAFRSATTTAFVERCTARAARFAERLHQGGPLESLESSDDELAEIIDTLLEPDLDLDDDDEWDMAPEDESTPTEQDDDERETPPNEQQLEHLIEREEIAEDLDAAYPVGIRWGAELSGVFPMLILGRPKGVAVPALDALGDDSRRVWSVGRVMFSVLEQVADDPAIDPSTSSPGPIAVLAELRVAIGAGDDWPPPDGRWETVRVVFLGHRDATLLTEFVKSGKFEATVPEACDGDDYDSITGHVDTLLLVDMLEAFGLLDRDVLRGN